MTVEPDEVWILMSTMKAFGVALPLTSAVDNPVTTTGGLHFLLHGLISLAWGGNILVHRLASIAAVLILLGLVFKILERQVNKRVVAFAGTALFATAPGFLLQASLATAEILATLAFLLAALHWIYFGSRSMGMAVLGGIFFGVACATRMTCLSMLPAIFVWSLFTQRCWHARVFYPLLAIAVAGLVFIGFMAIYFSAFGGASWQEYLTVNGLSSGLGKPFPGIMMRLNYLAVVDGIIPALALISLAGWFVSQLHAKKNDNEVLGVCGFLLLAGSAGWLSWVLRAPIPHIRYLWPSIPLFWLVVILLSASALERVTQPRTLMIAHISIVLMCAAQGLLNMRLLAVGDSLTLVYEIARESTLGTPQNFFVARNTQNEMANVLASLPATANIYAIQEAAAYPMTYLSNRTIKSLRQATKASDLDYLLVQPYDRSIWLPRWNLIGWLQSNTTLKGRRGEYELYQVREGVSLPLP